MVGGSAAWRPWTECGTRAESYHQGDPLPTPASHCYVIAEVGINHNGSLDIAKDLIRLAVETGCDAVKFQKRTIDVVYTEEQLDQPRESPWGTTQRAQKEGLEFGKDEFDEIDRYCRTLGIDWFASAWDLESLDFVTQYKPPHHKIASAMVTNDEFVRAVAALGVHTFISTAMSDWDDVDRVVATFDEAGCPFTLLHCVGTYPMPDEDANLNAMLNMVERYGRPVGFSSHEVGLICSMTAATLGATTLERHITLDRAMYGSDQAASLERPGLERLVRDVRELPQIMGGGEKEITPEEQPIARKLRYFVAP
jgi:N-acetylneuraminate synthase